MNQKEFISKWNVGYESLEQKEEFAKEMEADLKSLLPTSTASDIRDAMDTDMEESRMAQGEIESCLNHWNNKYIILKK